MCGLGALIGDMNHAKAKYFDTLCYIDALRGWDSTGVFTVEPKGGEVKHFKDALPAADFLRQEKYRKLKNVNDVMWVLHNRATTVGEINAENAHPFDGDRYIGVHNGTLTGWRHDLEDTKEFDVDSAALYHNINKYGLKETLEKTNGAYALIMYDKQEHELVFVRNRERPLYFGFTNDKKNVILVSDVNMHNLAVRYTRGANFTFTNENTLANADVQTIYRLPLPDGKKIELKESDLKKESFTRKWQRTTYNTWSNYPQHHNHKSSFNGSTSNKLEREGRESGKVLDLESIRKEKGIGEAAVKEAAKRLLTRFHNNDYVDFVCRSVVWEKEKGHEEWMNSIQVKKRQETEKLSRLSNYTNGFTRFTGHQADLIINSRHRLAFYEDLEGVISGDFWENWTSANPDPVKEEAEADAPEKKLKAPREGQLLLPYIGGPVSLSDMEDIARNTPCLVCGRTDDEPHPQATWVSTDKDGDAKHVCKNCVDIPFVYQMIITGELDGLT